METPTSKEMDVAAAWLDFYDDDDSDGCLTSIKKVSAWLKEQSDKIRPKEEE